MLIYILGFCRVQTVMLDIIPLRGLFVCIRRLQCTNCSENVTKLHSGFAKVPQRDQTGKADHAAEPQVNFTAYLYSGSRIVFYIYIYIEILH